VGFCDKFCITYHSPYYIVSAVLQRSDLMQKIPYDSRPYDSDARPKDQDHASAPDGVLDMNRNAPVRTAQACPLVALRPPAIFLNEGRHGRKSGIPFSVALT